MTHSHPQAAIRGVQAYWCSAPLASRAYWHLFIGSSGRPLHQSHLHRRLSHHQSQQPTFSFSAAHRPRRRPRRHRHLHPSHLRYRHFHRHRRLHRSLHGRRRHPPDRHLARPDIHRQPRLSIFSAAVAPTRLARRMHARLAATTTLHVLHAPSTRRVAMIRQSCLQGCNSQDIISRSTWAMPYGTRTAP